MNPYPRENILFCLCGPAASGKSTICKALLEMNSIRLSVSSTTRMQREGEVDGRDYNFISRDEFENRIRNQNFIEYTQFNGNYYGTEKQVVESAINDKVDLLLDIEIIGVQNLKTLFPDRVVTVFIFPKSYEELKRRFIARGDCETVLKSRLAIAKKEVEVLTSNNFSDYFLLNEDLSEAIQIAKGIVEAERSKMRRINKEFLTQTLQT